MTQTSHEPSVGFADLGISSKILAILERLEFKSPTPIQHQSIPPGLEGKDIIGIAQTGTGKTLAFAIPMIERLQQMEGKGLILIPTRELAHQVNETVQKIGKAFGINTAVLIGGEPMFKQMEALRRKPRVIIATPGRLIDHLQRKTVKLQDTKILVLDEADRMFDMGFAPQIDMILESVPANRQTLLYSATMSSGIINIVGSHMNQPVKVEAAPAGTSAEKVEQEVVIVRDNLKMSLLEKVLQENGGTTLVFSRTKFGAKEICQNLNYKGYRATEIHSNRSQGQRKAALEGFKRGRFQILVATDIAARGIDVTDIKLVVNFDLPNNSEDYVHRIGRTGRAGKEGKAISFATPHQKREVRGIERLIRKNLKVVSSGPLDPSKDASSFVEESFSADSASRNTRGRPQHSRGRAGSGPRRPFPERQNSGFGRKKKESRPAGQQYVW